MRPSVRRTRSSPASRSTSATAARAPRPAHPGARRAAATGPPEDRLPPSRRAGPAVGRARGGRPPGAADRAPYGGDGVRGEQPVPDGGVEHRPGSGVEAAPRRRARACSSDSSSASMSAPVTDASGRSPSAGRTCLRSIRGIEGASAGPPVRRRQRAWRSTDRRRRPSRAAESLTGPPAAPWRSCPAGPPWPCARSAPFTLMAAPVDVEHRRPAAVAAALEDAALGDLHLLLPLGSGGRWPRRRASRVQRWTVVTGTSFCSAIITAGRFDRSRASLEHRDSWYRGLSVRPGHHDDGVRRPGRDFGAGSWSPAPALSRVGSDAGPRS